jgi:hypothetical protein
MSVVKVQAVIGPESKTHAEAGCTFRAASICASIIAAIRQRNSGYIADLLRSDSALRYSLAIGQVILRTDGIFQIGIL